MILEILSAVVVVIFVSLVGYLLVLGAKNHRKHQFFKKFAPGLKVVPNPSLFGGHTNQIVHTKYNCSKVDEIIKSYGPTVGFYYGSDPAVFTCDLDFIKTFTIDEQIHINRRKIDIPMQEEGSLMTAEDEQWVKIRKAFAPALSKHKISTPNVKSDINKIIDKFVGLIERRLDKAEEERQEDFIEQDAEDVAGRYSLALVFTNFYKQDEVIDFQSEKDHYVDQMVRAQRFMLGSSVKLLAAFPIFNPLVEWLILNFHEIGVTRQTIKGFIEQQTKVNFEAAKQAEEACQNDQGQKQTFNEVGSFSLKDGSKFRRNMIDHVTDQYREGKLTGREYLHSTFFLVFAAYNTVADALSRLLYNLAAHPNVQEKLRASILESGIDSEYLHWVLNETMRLHPPVPIGCSRTIKRDIQTKHGLVPAGTFCVTPAYTINRLKEYWGQDADEFKPERWVNSKNFHPVQFLSFGGGRRVCPGRELALMEIKMLVDVLLRKYKFDVSEIHTQDDSHLFTAPLFAFLLFDTPTFVRISRLQQTQYILHT